MRQPHRAPLGIAATAVALLLIQLHPISAGAAPSIAWERSVARSLSSVVADDAGNVYATGFRVDRSTRREDPYMVLYKYSSAGEPQWKRTWKPSHAWAEGLDLAIGDDGSVYLSGIVNMDGYEGSQSFIRKYSPAGALLWRRQTPHWRTPYLVGHAESISGIAVGAGMVAVSGSSFGCCGDVDNDGWVRAYDLDGYLQWTSPFEASQPAGTNDAANAIAIGGFGRVYVVGWVATGSETDVGMADHEIMVQKLGPSGGVVWTHVFFDHHKKDRDGATGISVRGDQVMVTAESGGNWQGRSPHASACQPDVRRGRALDTDLGEEERSRRPAIVGFDRPVGFDLRRRHRARPFERWDERVRQEVLDERRPAVGARPGGRRAFHERGRCLRAVRRSARDRMADDGSLQLLLRVGRVALEAPRLSRQDRSGMRDSSSMSRAVRMVVNGAVHELPLEPERSLLSVLRDELGLTGAKPGCGEGACGACTVLLDGEPVRSCVTLAIDVGDRAITTVEGLARDGKLHPVQRAFIEEGAMQCGYCTPGMIVGAAALLGRTPNPSETRIREFLDGNVCRCCTYPRIVRAVRRAAELAASDDGGWLEERGAVADAVAPELPAPGRGPWDLLAVEERDYFDVLSDGMVVVCPPSRPRVARGRPATARGSTSVRTGSSPRSRARSTSARTTGRPFPSWWPRSCAFRSSACGW